MAARVIVRLAPLVLLALAGCRPEPTIRQFAEPPLLADEDPADGRFAATVTAAAVTRDFEGDPVQFLGYNGVVCATSAECRTADVRSRGSSQRSTVAALAG